LIARNRGGIFGHRKSTHKREGERDKGTIITQRGKLIEESKCLLTASNNCTKRVCLLWKIMKKLSCFNKSGNKF
jgi:hypothetical protein